MVIHQKEQVEKDDLFLKRAFVEACVCHVNAKTQTHFEYTKE